MSVENEIWFCVAYGEPFHFLSRFGGVCASGMWLYEPVTEKGSRAVYTSGMYIPTCGASS